jgi:hypothetical protein
MEFEDYSIGVALQPHRRWDSTGELAWLFSPLLEIDAIISQMEI